MRILCHEVDFSLREEFLDLGHQKSFRVSIVNEGKFDSIYKKDFIKNAALCQKILYKLIDQNVLSVQEEEGQESARGEREQILIYQNIEYKLWKQREKRLKKESDKSELSMGFTANPGLSSIHRRFGSLNMHPQSRENSPSRVVLGENKPIGST